MNTEDKLKTNDFTKALAECIHQAQGSIVDPMAHAEIWKDALLKFAKGEECVSEDMWEASKQYALRQVFASTDAVMTEQAYLSLKLFSGFEIAVAHKDGANWQRQQMMKNAKDGIITFDYYGDNDKIYGCIAHDSFSLEELGLKDGDKVKMIIIKEDEQ
jgi:hypothetical protein